MNGNGAFFDRFASRLTVQGRLVAQTGLRIGAGRSTDPYGSDLPVVRDALGRPYIPGASLKGVLRSAVESYLRAIADSSGACYPVGDDREHCVSNDQARRIRDKTPDDAALAVELWKASCLACRTFGSPWLASHVAVSDLAVDPELWAGQFEVRNGVAIDRDTETAKDGLLYAYETIPAGTAFRCRIEAENAQPWQLGLLLLALRPFERGEATIGGGTTRGLGRVQLEDVEARYFELAGDDPVTEFINYLAGGATGQPVTEIQRTGWLDALKIELRHAVAQAQEAAHA